MNYTNIYNRIVNRARGRILEGYTERHHILPRCLGGNNNKENIVRLTPEEHYVAHQLLVKMHPGTDKLVYAAMLMTQCSNGARINNKLFGWIKKRLAEARRGPHSEERKKKNSLAQIGKKLSEKTKAKMSSSRKGVPKTEEQKRKSSEAQLGRKKTPEQIERNRQAQLKVWAQRRLTKDS